MFDSTRIVLSAGKGQIGSSLRRSDHLTRSVDPRRRMRGFSVVELLTTVIILLVVSAMAVFQMQPMWQQIQANAGLDQVKSTLRQARELAISERRTIVVQFLTAATGTSCPSDGGILTCIALTQMIVVAGTPPAPPTQTLATSPLLVFPIENKVQLISFASEPDTPDGFIGASPGAPNGLYSGSNASAPTTGMAFQSDGTFTDGNGNPINVSIFLGEAGIPSSARAVTILGNTGRVFAYHGTGTAWFR